MQYKHQLESNKKFILTALAKTLKELRGSESQFQFSNKSDVSIDIISKCERGLKDPQLTTLYKLAEGVDMTLTEFVAKIEQNIPLGISLIEK